MEDADLLSEQVTNLLQCWEDLTTAVEQSVTMQSLGEAQTEQQLLRRPIPSCPDQGL